MAIQYSLMRRGKVAGGTSRRMNQESSIARRPGINHSAPVKSIGGPRWPLEPLTTSRERGGGASRNEANSRTKGTGTRESKRPVINNFTRNRCLVTRHRSEIHFWHV